MSNENEAIGLFCPKIICECTITDDDDECSVCGEKVGGSEEWMKKLMLKGGTKNAG